MVTGFRKPQSLSLVERVEQEQVYRPLSTPSELMWNWIGLYKLSDEHLKNLYNLLPKEKVSSGKFVFEEGIFDTLGEGVCKEMGFPISPPIKVLLISIQYDLDKGGPLIEVPGIIKFPLKDYENDIKIDLLNEQAKGVFVEKVLKKSHEPSTKLAYTGKYFIWPGDLPLEGTVRQIPNF